MRLKSFDRIGMSGMLIVFGFALSANAQTESSNLANSEGTSDKRPSENPMLFGTRTGLDLFEHQWKPTSPSKVGTPVRDPLHSRNREGLADASSSETATTPTPDAQPTPKERLEARRAAILRQRATLQSGLPVSPVMTMVRDRVGDGLGPLHNATSCADCHPNGGASGVEHNVTLITVDPRSLAVKVANDKNGKQLLELFPSLLNELGTLSIETVVHDQSTGEGYDEIRSQLASHVPGGIDDAWFVPASRTSEAIARQPVVAGRRGDVDFYLSQRNSPALYGLGLIDRISTQRLAALAKKQAEESGGEISGRVAMKFGWRGQIGSVSAFVSQACAGELGLTQMTVPQPGDPVNLSYQPPGVDMSIQDVIQLTSHVASIPVPTETTPPGHTWQQMSNGESTFNAIGCASCHVPDVYPALNIFSDLLLHDMGEALQAPSPAPVGDLTLAGIMSPQTYPTKGPISGTTPAYYSGLSVQTLPRAEAIETPEQPQFPRGSRPKSIQDAAYSVVSVAGKMDWKRGVTWDDLQREWRTPPLWGIADTGPYLHDGRASTLEEAIHWHGGEAKSSRDQFEALNESDKTALLAFLSSLRAPEDARSPSETTH